MNISNKHYVRTDSNGYITKGFSNAFEESLESDICITEEGGRHFELNGIVNPPLYNEEIIPIYKYDNGAIRNCTQAEINEYKAELPPAPKSQIEILQETVDVLVISMLGGQ